MKRSYLLLTAAAVLAAAVVVWLVTRPAGDVVSVDLIESLPSAVQVRPSRESYTIQDVTLAGVTKRAIVGTPPGRIVWSVNVRENAWLKVSPGMLEPSWTVAGDGVLFLVGVSDGTTYTELLSLVMDPYANTGDRSWQEFMLDLSAYQGQTIEVIFNTRSSAPARPPVDNREGDMPAWGQPQIVIR